MKKLVILLLVLFACAVFATEYKLIQRSEDGRYYLDEETILLLANHIAKLEALNENYKLQISNLEQQVKTLKELLANADAQKKLLEEENAKLRVELEKLKSRQTFMTVVAAIIVGGLVILFLK